MQSPEITGKAAGSTMGDISQNFEIQNTQVWGLSKAKLHSHITIVFQGLGDNFRDIEDCHLSSP